jgi:hypothetical protein
MTLNDIQCFVQLGFSSNGMADRSPAVPGIEFSRLTKSPASLPMNLTCFSKLSQLPNFIWNLNSTFDGKIILNG